MSKQSETSRKIISKITKTFSVVLAFAWMVSCSQSEEAKIVSPDEVALKYLQYKAEGNDLKINELISQEDREYVLTKEETVLESLNIDVANYEELTKKISDNFAGQRSLCINTRFCRSIGASNTRGFGQCNSIFW